VTPTSFTHYFSLLQEGKEEADAFAESFKVNYEDLDRLLLQGIGEPSHIYIVRVQTPTEGLRGAAKAELGGKSAADGPFWIRALGVLTLGANPHDD
jgi:hypothetical protein